MDRLSKAFSETPDLFVEVTDVKYPAEIEFPLGRPFGLRHRNFFELFDLKGYLAEHEFISELDGYSQESLIWICPSGTVLVMAGTGFDNKSGFSLEQFENEVVEQHYPELSYVFSDVANIVMSLIQKEFLDSALCCKDYLERFKKLCELRTRIVTGEGSSRKPWKLSDYFQQNPNARDVFEEVLIDVYYVGFSYTPNEEDESICVVFYEATHKKGA